MQARGLVSGPNKVTLGGGGRTRTPDLAGALRLRRIDSLDRDFGQISGQIAPVYTPYLRKPQTIANEACIRFPNCSRWTWTIRQLRVLQ